MAFCCFHYFFHFSDQNIIIPFPFSLYFLQTLPYALSPSVSNSRSLFSLIITWYTLYIHIPKQTLLSVNNVIYMCFQGRWTRTTNRLVNVDREKAHEASVLHKELQATKGFWKWKTLSSPGKSSTLWSNSKLSALFSVFYKKTCINIWAI